MSIRNWFIMKMVAVCVVGLGFLLFVASKMDEKRVDVLEHVDVSTCATLVAALHGELIGIAKKNYCGTEGVLALRLGSAWEEMLHQGKATQEERDAVLNFENALENLSDAMEKIGRIPELRKKLRL